jgi:hypothetical protein
MKLAIIASLLAGAAAFSPVARQPSSSALQMSFASEVGAQQPLGFFGTSTCNAFPCVSWTLAE